MNRSLHPELLKATVLGKNIWGHNQLGDNTGNKQEQLHHQRRWKHALFSGKQDNVRKRLGQAQEKEVQPIFTRLRYYSLFPKVSSNIPEELVS